MDTGLEAVTGGPEISWADHEAEAVAAERIRSGATQRTRDGAEALAELGIAPALSDGSTGPERGAPCATP
jgi:hypothetical protein